MDRKRMRKRKGKMGLVWFEGLLFLWDGSERIEGS